MSAAMEEPGQSIKTVQQKQERPVRKRRRVYGEKVCQVCGDKALAHHFGTLACETCKAFFRRNALNKEQRKCLFKGDCPINIKTRRFCPACRLTKCFRVGMQADLILDEDEKKQRMLKMTEKKIKRDQTQLPPEPDRSGTLSTSPSSSCGVTTTGAEVCSPTSSMVEQAWLVASETSVADTLIMSSPGSFSVDNKWNQEGLLVEAGQNIECIRSNLQGLVMGQESRLAVLPGRDDVPQPSAEFSYSPTPATPASGAVNSPESWQSAPSTTNPTTPQLYSEDTQSSCTSSLPQCTMSFKHVPHNALPSDPYMYWRLSEEERSLLTQLSAAYQDTVLSVLQGNPPRENISSQYVTQEFYLQACELEVGNVVSFAKRMEDFRQLRLDEQIALLKASTCQVLGIRSCALYIAEKDAWITPKGHLTLSQCMHLFPGHPHIEASLNFCRTIKSIIKNDVTLYALLHCLVLFDPSDDRIIDRQLINSIRDKYVILLRHYLESVYSYTHSEKYMMALQENLIFYRNLSLEGKPLIKKFFPSIPNKLLIEVLDLEGDW